MERFVQVNEHYRLWVDEVGPADASLLLLVMGANTPGPGWPEGFVAQLAQHHRVIRFDHRDTGRSTWAFDEHPYAVVDLASDAVAILDELGVERAHVVGMSMGAILTQLLLIDHPDRLLSGTVFATTALGAGLASGGDADSPPLPNPDPRLLALWEQMADPRDREAEIKWRVEHWRLLNGDVLPFDADEFRQLEAGIINHAGRHDSTAAHARADQSGLDRGAELADVTVPTLVIEAPEEPINPPPHAVHTARTIGNAQLVTIPGMGHALGSPVITPLVTSILAHTTRADLALAIGS